MTAQTETPVYPCTCRPGCPHTMADPSGEAHGWATACYRRWQRAGKPDGSPPEPRPVRGHGRITKAETAERLGRFAGLRSRGLTVAAAAEQMGVSVMAAEHYAAVLRQRVRDEVMEAAIAWPRPASPLPGVSHWSGQAACRGHHGLFYAPDGPETLAAREVRDAKARSLCAACPVRAQCRDETERGPGRSGTWAGVSEDDREREKKRRAAQARAERDRRNAAEQAAGRREQDVAA